MTEPQSEQQSEPTPDISGTSAPDAGRPDLPPAAQRALAEAAERRRIADAATPPPLELGGRKGPEPVRYGDWEKKGIAVDF